MAKGGAFENDVCKALSLWWTGGERDDVFRRTQGSGSRFTRRKKNDKDTHLQGGDITAIDVIGEPLMIEWSIECKTGYGARYKKVVGKKKGQKTFTSVVNWCLVDALDSRLRQTVFERLWEQCNQDAIASNRRPVLIYRRTMRMPTIAITKRYFDYLRSYFGNVNATNITYSSVQFNSDIVVMSLAAFFDWIPDIRESLEKTKV